MQQTNYDRPVKTKDTEILCESEADRLISEIVSRTRIHPGVVRGASVRGAIAFKEVLLGLSDMQNGLTRSGIRQAALITLPPRILAREDGDRAAIVNDIVNQVLYGMPSSSLRDGTEQPLEWDLLSPEDIMEGLKNLRRLSREQVDRLAKKGRPTIIDDPDKNREILKYLEANKFLRRGGRDQLSLTTKALEYLMNELERKLRDGEITLEEYNREKDRLMGMLRNASRPKSKMSARELANTMMELMEAQDGHCSSGIDFERMYIYYHIKANSEGRELSPQKRDYYGLKVLIDSLEEQGILRTAETGSDFVLTSEALDMLLEYLIEKDARGEGLRGAIDFEKRLLNERRHEIRRYSSGDVFRDISFRHTLREIARQKKSLSSVRKSDFRVFMKQPRKLKSDIVLCLDTSGSMAFQHKFLYARLAATGLAKAAIDDGNRVGVVAFDSLSRSAIPLGDSDKDAIFDYIIGLKAQGNTNIGEGVKRASQLLFQDGSSHQKHILLITDGQPTALSQAAFDQLKRLEEKDLSEESAILETRKAAARGVEVSVLHVASQDEAGDKFVRDIARAGRGKVRRMGSPEDLKAIMR